ncbi:NAD-dependent epimerase/dehydratase family protein [filamentous cyanobacterium LEGE 11480]|uniref:NAD-dependent epimerase/dehydratase family protein n=1 Tax=Romeriopsis navalis LEGE 11480 TaxID=2777977 RepID=A0A928Z3G9_9CYAN|nr:hopanoid-associated sugar epimerase [Romeriopsis navalis]MBE9030017.1 NAD-dependent epimerase/dehydratase family protein [Romeriopsis navalis LEGE 11480]
MVKAFVTGGTGFVGANLVRLLLKQNFVVKALARPQSPRDNLRGLDVEWITSDLNDPQIATHLQGCDYLFHVAAHYSLWRTEKDRLHQINVLGTRNILAAAQQAGIKRTVYTSSVAAIGVLGQGRSADETYQSPPHKLIGAYKQSKYWAEQEAHNAIAAGQDIVIVNPSTPIGPYDIKPTPTGDTILRFLKRKMPAYVDTGLNLIHVEDVAMGHLLALQKGQTGERYILGNQNVSLKQMLDMLAEITGTPAPKTAIPVWIPLAVAGVDEMLLARLGKTPDVPIDGVRMSRQKMYYDPSKAIATLGLPQTPVAVALQDAVNWFVSNGYV